MIDSLIITAIKLCFQFLYQSFKILRQDFIMKSPDWHWTCYLSVSVFHMPGLQAFPTTPNLLCWIQSLRNRQKNRLKQWMSINLIKTLYCIFYQMYIYSLLWHIAIIFICIPNIEISTMCSSTNFYFSVTVCEHYS